MENAIAQATSHHQVRKLVAGSFSRFKIRSCLEIFGDTEYPQRKNEIYTFSAFQFIFCEKEKKRCELL